MSIFTQLQDEYATEFKVSSDGEQVTRVMADAYIGNQQTLDSGIKMICEPSQDTIYLTKGVTITCSIDNAESLKKIQLCWPFSDCENVRLNQGINNISKNMSFYDTGFKTLIIEANTQKGNETAFLKLNVIDPASINITNLTYDQNISFDGNSTIKFVLQKMSKSTPRNIDVILKHDVFMREWKMQTLECKQELSYDVEGKYFTSNANHLNLTVTYYDDTGKLYSNEEEIIMQVMNPNIWQRLILWFNSANVWLIKIFGG